MYIYDCIPISLKLIFPVILPAENSGLVNGFEADLGTKISGKGPYDNDMLDTANQDFSVEVVGEIRSR